MYYRKSGGQWYPDWRAARRIGLATSEQFLKAGARVTLAELNAAEAKKLAKKLDPSGQRTRVVDVDITKEAQVQTMAGHERDHCPPRLIRHLCTRRHLT